ncbi:MAG: hypothetical protein RLY14_1688 [Planctomycetota bacterium]
MRHLQIESPHDKFFRFAFKHVDLVRDLIQWTFPASLVNQLDLSQIRWEAGSWTDSKLQDKRADLLFSCPTQKQSDSRKSQSQKAFLYVLLEHKSVPDHYTVLQVLSYLLRIWEEQQREKTLLTPIFALVIYHGTTPWNAPTNISELLGPQFATLDLQLNFQLRILDLTTWTENQQETSPILTSTLQLLKYSRKPELINLLREIFERWRDSLVSQSLKQWLQAAWNYVMSTNQDLTDTQVQEIVDELLSVQYEPGSLVDRLYRQGHSEGLTKGHAEGKAEGLANGTERGIFFGRIQLLQQLLGFDISSKEDLLQLTLSQVHDLVTSLEQRLKDKST